MRQTQAFTDWLALQRRRELIYFYYTSWSPPHSESSDLLIFWLSNIKGCCFCVKALGCPEKCRFHDFYKKMHLQIVIKTTFYIFFEVWNTLKYFLTISTHFKMHDFSLLIFFYLMLLNLNATSAHTESSHFLHQPIQLLSWKVLQITSSST